MKHNQLILNIILQREQWNHFFLLSLLFKETYN